MQYNAMQNELVAERERWNNLFHPRDIQNKGFPSKGHIEQGYVKSY